MDGTLLDTEALAKVAIMAACRVLGFEMTDGLHGEMIGHPREHNVLLLSNRFGAGFDPTAYLDHCRREMASLSRDGIPLKHGVVDLLAELRERGVPIAIATSTPRDEALHHLRGAGLLDAFSAIVTRSDVEFGKPHPETFLRAARLLGVEPAQCLAVEDSHNGVRAAHAAGMTTIMVPDLMPPTDEIAALCWAVHQDLEHVHGAIRAGRIGFRADLTPG
jgi:HAD superfamily hydrolase (TIGR01509 family)